MSTSANNVPTQPILGESSRTPVTQHKGKYVSFVWFPLHSPGHYDTSGNRPICKTRICHRLCGALSVPSFSFLDMKKKTIQTTLLDHWPERVAKTIQQTWWSKTVGNFLVYPLLKECFGRRETTLTRLGIRHTTFIYNIASRCQEENPPAMCSRTNAPASGKNRKKKLSSTRLCSILGPDHK